MMYYDTLSVASVKIDGEYCTLIGDKECIMTKRPVPNTSTFSNTAVVLCFLSGPLLPGGFFWTSASQSRLLIRRRIERFSGSDPTQHEATILTKTKYLSGPTGRHVKLVPSYL